MNSRGPFIVHIKRNFAITVASCVSVIMPVDFKVVRIKQVFRFNSGRINHTFCGITSFLPPLTQYVRELSRKQFMARATIMKARSTAGLAAHGQPN